MQQLAHSDSGNIRKFSGIPVPSATRKKVNDGPLTQPQKRGQRRHHRTAPANSHGALSP